MDGNGGRVKSSVWEGRDSKRRTRVRTLQDAGLPRERWGRSRGGGKEGTGGGGGRVKGLRESNLSSGRPKKKRLRAVKRYEGGVGESAGKGN